MSAGPGLVSAAAASAVAGVGVAASLLGQTALVAPVLAAQVLLVLGWYSVLKVPGWELGSALAIGCGFIGDIAMVVHEDDPSLGPLAGILGPAMVGVIAIQLARRDDRRRVTASVTATATATVMSVLAAALVAERGATHGRTVTVVAVLAAGVTTVVLALPVRPELTEVAAVPIGVVVAVLLGRCAGDLGSRQLLVVAVGAGSLAWAGRRAAGFTAFDLTHQAAGGSTVGGDAAGRASRRAVVREARRSSEAILVVGSALPVVLAAPASYVLGRLLVG
jgi:hypothetical protein